MRKIINSKSLSFKKLVPTIGALLIAPSALAQSEQICRALNADWRNLQQSETQFSSTKLLQAVQRQKKQIRRAERDFASEGCNKRHVDAYLLPICDGIEDVLDKMYGNLDNLKNQAAYAKTARSQTRRIKRQAKRHGCDLNSTVTIAKQMRTLPNSRYAPNHTTALSKPDDAYYTNLNPGHTLRTMCVRESDGYYWPVSFSTTKRFLQRDVTRCEAMCPQTKVSLYYYKNIGGSVRQMVSMSGDKYTDSDSAFLYHKQRDQSVQCRAEIDPNLVAKNESSAIQNESFIAPTAQKLALALPPTDPRLAIQIPATQNPVAEFKQTYTADETELRTINSSGQTIRLVGPDTPYVQLAEESS